MKIFFKIAGLTITFDSKELPLDCSDNHNYKKFISFENQNSSDVICKIERKNFVIDEDMRETSTYDENTWFLYRNDFENFIFSKFYDTSSPPLVLHFDHDFNNVGIYFTEASIKQIDGKKYITNIFTRPFDQLIIIYSLLKNFGLMLHAAGVKIDGRGFLFPGISETGKSTIAKSCMKFGISSWLSDERIIVRKSYDGFDIFGTPWSSAANVSLNTQVPLAGIFVIKHGTEPEIKKISSKETIAKILPTASILWHDEVSTEIALKLVEEIIKKVPVFEFSYKPNKGAIDELRRFISREM